jgi:hypothetical protein
MRSTLISLVLALAATPALADSTSPWSFGGSVGYDLPVGGKVMDAGTSNSIVLNTLNSNFTGTGTIQLRGTDFKDAYDPALRATIEVRYAMSDLSEFFGAFSYTKADGKSVDVGCLTNAGACNGTLTGQFADYKQMGIEIGYRQWINMAMLGDSVRPYFAVRGGVLKTDAIDTLLKAPLGNVARWRLYDDSYSYMIGADLGATVAISQNAEIGGEVGLRYQTALKEIDTDFGALGLGKTNGNSERLSVPVSVRLNAAF